MRTSSTTSVITSWIILALALVMPLSAIGQWQTVSGTYNDRVSSIAFDGKIGYAGGFGVLLRSADSGATWTNVKTWTTTADFASMVVTDSGVFAGTYEAVLRSTDKGTSWGAVGGVLTGKVVKALAFGGGLLIAGTNEGCLRSRNLGQSWDTVSGIPSSDWVYVLAFQGTTLFAGTNSSIYRSTDFGGSWRNLKAAISPIDVHAIAFIDSTMYVGTWGGGFFTSGDAGDHWAACSSAPEYGQFVSLALSTHGLFVNDQNSSKLYFVQNKGANWQTVSGLANEVNVLYTCGDYVYAGTRWNISRARLADILPTSGVQGTRSLSERFALDQNYPNPFNPSTRIAYELSTTGRVRLSVLDLLGREVGLLVDDVRSAGRHEATFDATHLASGIYFYRLQAESYVNVKRMAVMK